MNAVTTTRWGWAKVQSQDTKIVRLQTASGVCNNSQDIAEQLRKLANEIESGEYANVRIACTVIDSDEGIFRRTLGPAGTCKIEAVGLLTYAIHKAIEGE